MLYIRKCPYLKGSNVDTQYTCACEGCQIKGQKNGFRLMAAFQMCPLLVVPLYSCYMNTIDADFC